MGRRHSGMTRHEHNANHPIDNWLRDLFVLETVRRPKVKWYVFPKDAPGTLWNFPAEHEFVLVEVSTLGARRAR